jgi:hypothetical protein
MIATSSSATAAGAVGSKAARACDGCLRRRARWYCAADDAFLCQGCDTSVHSANPLARRHERLRLQPSSSPLPAAAKQRGRGDEVVPAWFRRKARTPRGGHSAAAKSVGSRRLVVVPEAAASGGNSPEGERLLYRVPVFDPALAEFCSPPLEDATTAAASSCCNNEDGAVENPTKPDAAPPPQPTTQFFPGGHASLFEPTDKELREFAADMEALLGRGLDDGTEEDSFYMETLGLLDPPVDEGARVFKVEAEGFGGAYKATDDAPACCFDEAEPEKFDEMLNIDFDYGSPQETPDDAKLLQRSLSLTLNYEEIIQSWGSSPWTVGGDRPHAKLDDCWPHDYTVRSHIYAAVEHFLCTNDHSCHPCRAVRVHDEHRLTNILIKGGC